MGDRRFETWTALALGSLAGTGQTTGRNVGAYKEANFYFRATSAGSTLDFVIETSPDDSNYYTLASVTQITGTGNSVHNLSGNLGKYLRLSYTASGTWGVGAEVILKT